MDRRWVVAGALAVGTLGTGATGLRAQGGAGSTWLHVRVEDEGARPSKVSVNLPMTVVEAALSIAPETVIREGKFQIGRHNGVSVADLRKIWAELKSAGDTELVSVEEKDETVKVSRKGDLVQVRVVRAGGEQGVRVDVPVSLVDAALGGEGDTLDVKALVKELSKRRGDVVNVNEKDSKVRIWIDESSSGGGK